MKNDNVPTERAARQYGVPAQTLRDRILGKVHIDSYWGKTSLFSHDEEESLVDHLEELARIGYGLNRSQLTLSQTTKFRLFQIEKICRRQFYFAGNGRKFFKQVENTVGKGEIARYEQFLLFPQCVQKTCIADT